ncbi:hypothetical protein ACWDV7_36340 [Streptomyces sp. NPDC003362]
MDQPSCGGGSEILAWQVGLIAPGREQWVLGEALDVLARTGDVPRTLDPRGREHIPA